ncbi:phage portal protein [Enterococcus plantarum]|uniref:phage portal protein n=1 Tax=Enterococcus plantarum TaxID=1077675 RepID=UPI00084D1F5A|nr:phage portal protein [Enterococcus plantarum]OEG09399.1 phage portal protein [Enterococcus plantarum]
MEKKLLNGSRFDEEANKVYRLPVNKLPKRLMGSTDGYAEEVIDFENEDMLKMIVKFIRHHKEKQVPRLQELKRYSLAQNNIKFTEDKSADRADNKIANDWASFIVNFKKGVLLGNPLKYSGEKTIANKINEFASQSNEDYHNQLMADDLLALGRAYEYVGRDEYGKETLIKFNPECTFVIYDTTKNANSICGVNYYDVEFNDETTSYVDIYANDGFLYQFGSREQDYDNLTLYDHDQTYFNTVQINEWVNNEERLGDFEKVLDNIDAYDLSQSSMANFQQDSSEAYLVIKGNPETAADEEGKNTKLEVLNAMIKARVLVLGDKKHYGEGQTGSEPDAYYLKKEYDTAGTEAYNDRLVSDMLRFTSLIDFTDENMGGNQSGIGFRFKGWGNDNDRKNKERMIKKAIMRRLRLLTHSWSLKDNLNKPQGFADKVKSIFMSADKKQESLYDKVNEIEILFTPNVPQSDEEIMKVIAGMVGIVSDETLCEMAAKLTGVPAETEIKRIKKETDDSVNRVYDGEPEKEVDVNDDEEQPD